MIVNLTYLKNLDTSQREYRALEIISMYLKGKEEDQNIKCLDRFVEDFTTMKFSFDVALYLVTKIQLSTLKNSICRKKFDGLLKYMDSITTCEQQRIVMKRVRNRQ